MKDKISYFWQHRSLIFDLLNSMKHKCYCGVPFVDSSVEGDKR